jgi:hypothetical protein
MQRDANIKRLRKLGDVSTIRGQVRQPSVERAPLRSS